MKSAMWVADWPHDAPDEPLSIPDAHLTMQRHCGCSRFDCPRKTAAWIALVDAGRIAPGGSTFRRTR
jgi:hypothetical protein